ncbi:MAG: hypothetical protein QNI84_04635 [Henriciella sp.]|nr:hypothetical protein [Henriciella sp.]
MKNVILASVAAFTLAACGGGGNLEAKLTASCLEDGSATAEQCECMTKAAVDGLDRDLLVKMVDASEAEDSDAAMMAIMADLSPEQQTQFMTVMMGAMTTCEVSG